MFVPRHEPKDQGQKKHDHLIEYRLPPYLGSRAKGRRVTDSRPSSPRKAVTNSNAVLGQVPNAVVGSVGSRYKVYICSCLFMLVSLCLSPAFPSPTTRCQSQPVQALHGSQRTVLHDSCPPSVILSVYVRTYCTVLRPSPGYLVVIAPPPISNRRRPDKERM